MKRYEKPVVLVNCELAEGVYLASGDIIGDITEDATNGGKKCDSAYMQGNWQAPNMDYQGGSHFKGYKTHYGCLGCNASWGSHCAVKSEWYTDAHNGNNMPEWERRGYGPTDEVTDWHCG